MTKFEENHPTKFTGIYKFWVSNRNDDFPEMIEEYSEKFNLKGVARERKIIDILNLHRDMIGQTSYQICHNNKNKYRTI